MKALAFNRRACLSGVLRALLDDVLGDERGDPGTVREVRIGSVGTGRDAAGDVARQHDRYRYGGRDT